MVSYTPPNEILSIFNSENFYSQGNDEMSQDQADLRYLKKIGGTLTGALRVKGAMQMDSTVIADTDDRIYVDSINNRVGINRTPTTYGLEVGSNSLFVGTKILRSDGNSQLTIQGNANNNKQLIVGFDTTNNYGVIQAVEQSVGYRDLITCQNGGWLRCGNSTQSYVPVVSNSSVKFDYGKSNNTNNTGSISFNFTFTSTPFVIGQMEANVANSLYVVNISSVSTTGFNWRKQYQQGGSSFGAGGDQFWWVAIGS